jgi:hypothetical protein
VKRWPVVSGSGDEAMQLAYRFEVITGGVGELAYKLGVNGTVHFSCAHFRCCASSLDDARPRDEKSLRTERQAAPRAIARGLA